LAQLLLLVRARTLLSEVLYDQRGAGLA